MINTPSMQELLEAGVHFGHQVRRGNPRMREYIFGVRDGVHIINLEHSEKLLKDAAEAAFKLGSEGKVLLVVGTKKQAQPIVHELATQAGAPYITFKWIGGLFTNFDEIRKNIKKLLDWQDKQEKGLLGHYTKKERLLISRKLQRFDKEYGGIVNLDKLPDAIFIADTVTDKTAVLESRKVSVPIIAVTDSNANPSLIDYPIPGNDDALKAIRILLEPVILSYGEGLKLSKSKAEAKEVKDNKKTKEIIIGEPIALDVAIAEEEMEKKALEDAARKE